MPAISTIHQFLREAHVPYTAVPHRPRVYRPTRGGRHTRPRMRLGQGGHLLYQRRAGRGGGPGTIGREPR